jgi:hypothetical protein
VDDAYAAFLRDRDGEARFGDRVHRRGDDRMLSRMPRVRRVDRSTSRGSTSEYAGTSRTSSKVSASWTIRMAGIPGAVRMKRRIVRRRPAGCKWRFGAAVA